MHRTPSRLARSAAYVAVVAALAACGSDDPAASAQSASSGPPSTSASSAASSPPTTSASSPVVVELTTTVLTAPVAELAEWQTTVMTDVDGTTFTVADFVGRPVLVETFATWCKNCRSQLGDTQTAAAELGDEAIVLALSVETDLSPGDVADYAADNGFTDIRFAVMTPEALAAFVNAFGNTVANPPSTPKVVVDAMGRPGELSTGAESAESLVQQLRSAAG